MPVSPMASAEAFASTRLPLTFGSRITDSDLYVFPPLGIWIATTPRDNAGFRHALERALQGQSLHGTRFRLIVERVAGAFHLGSDCEFRHPLGRRDSTLFSVGEFLHPLSFVAFRSRNRPVVEPVDTAGDLTDEFTGVPRLAAWSGSRLCVLVHFAGGTGSCDRARLFRLAGTHWELEKTLEPCGENVWEGARTRQRIVQSNPVDIRDVVLSRIPPPGLEARGDHNSLWYDYHQEWRFSGGTLREIARYQVPTPASETYALLHLVKARRRREFDRRVPARFQSRLWHEFATLDPWVTPQPGEGDKRDECSKLVVAHTLPITMSLVRGMWTITKVGSRGDW